MGFFLFTVTALISTNYAEMGNLGMNLEGKSYWIRGYSWKNRLMQSMPFISQNASSWQDDRPLDFDSNGYVKSLLPGQFTGSLFLDLNTDENGWHYTTQGTHIFLYDGDCTGCEFDFNAKVIDKSTNGRWLVNVSQTSIHSSGGNAYFKIMSIPDPSNYPKNFVLVPEQYEDNYKDDPWDPDWIRPLNETKEINTLRFKDFLRIDNTMNYSWDTRTLPSNYSQANNYGVAWELCIDLANRLDINPWVNIPEWADDDFIKNAATLLYNTFNWKTGNNRRIYLEYSNECWNGIYSCHTYCVNKGKENGMTPYQYYAQRVCNMRKIFDEVWGDDSKEHIYSVMGTQWGYPEISKYVLDNGTNECVNGLAVAPYYCMYNMTDEEKVDATMDELFAVLESEGQMNYMNGITQQHLDIIGNMTGITGEPLGIVTYEGGFGCTPDYSQYRDNLTVIYEQMVADSRIGDTVCEELQYYLDITGDQVGMNNTLYTLYNYIYVEGEYGDFSHLQWMDSYENEDEKGRYKWDGIDKYIKGNGKCS